MLHTVLALLAFGITVPQVPTVQSQLTRSAVCPATTDNGRVVVTNFVSAERHERSRRRNGITRSAPDRVRALGTRDANACAALMSALEREATRLGVPFQSSGLEFYQVGEFYFASRPLPPSSCRSGPDHACFDTRWQTLHILAHDQTFLRTIAL